MRPTPTIALAVVGVLAGLVVSAWGSLFAAHTLYPSYVTAFVMTETPGEETRAAAPDLDLAAQTDKVLSGLRLDEGIAPATPEVELAAMPGPVTEPAPLPAVEEGDTTSPQAMARLSETDAETRAAASLAAGQRAETADSESQAPATSTIDQASGADEAPGADPATGQPDTERAIAESPRPIWRPSVEAEAPSDLAEAETDGTITTSSMNNATELAVLTSPRPRALPRTLRMSALAPTAPSRDTVVEAAAQADTDTRAAAPRVSGNGCGRNHARNMPNRRAGAPTGSAFLAAVGNGSGGNRDNAIINELARGNMPGFLKELQPVVFRGRDARGASTEIVICVTPDYLALGSDSDFVRVPLGLPAAATIAKRFGMTLPTSRMVDAIYAQARVKLSPAPMQAGPQMSSTNYFLRHNATIEGQRKGRAGLISGHKKDVVIASRMASNPGRVAIYGWHRSQGNPIQPVSTVHGASYADYSHGIRLVSRTAYLNGRAVDLDELLASNRYAYLLNSDGPLPGPVIRIASR
ncbi:hypothetical protein [Maritimibacter sp. UBA3975]|uniref:hypothetical protein n=1 Tax=Maritimibacter sp. UBA3975 TaxID=1946833 RepID=UPI000C0B1488|nr:hypothetical protein [Maritimibacter sp. UBA3975]MAM62885.1 hypothetical protein [Maritimibacter sp.]